MEITSDEDWRIPLKKYVERGTLPKNEMEKKKLMHKAAWFVVINNNLYKRIEEEFSLGLCVTPEESEGIIREAHSRARGTSRKLDPSPTSSVLGVLLANPP